MSKTERDSADISHWLTALFGLVFIDATQLLKCTEDRLCSDSFKTFCYRWLTLKISVPSAGDCVSQHPLAMTWCFQSRYTCMWIIPIFFWTTKACSLLKFWLSFNLSSLQKKNQCDCDTCIRKALVADSSSNLPHLEGLKEPYSWTVNNLLLTSLSAIQNYLSYQIFNGLASKTSILLEDHDWNWLITLLTKVCNLEKETACGGLFLLFLING